MRSSTDAHQRQRIEACPVQHRGNWASAARELGLHRANLVRLVRLARRLGLVEKPPAERPAGGKLAPPQAGF